MVNDLHLENYSLRIAGRNTQKNRIVDNYVFFDLDDSKYNYDKLLDCVDVIIHLASRVHMIGEQDDGLLSGTSSKSPLKWEIAEHAEPWYFPNLAPGN